MTNNAIRLGKMPKPCWLKVSDIKIPEGRLHSYFENRSEFEDSIKADGVIQPIIVFEDENGVYWLADGENRLKSTDKPLIPAYVLYGNMENALLFSAKLNIHRGHYNIGELCEFVKRLKDKGMKVEEIAENLKLSKGYVSELLAVAENSEIVEKLKKGSFSLREAYKSLKSSATEQVSQETRQRKVETVSTPTVKQPLTNEDFGLTSNLKEATETGKRFKPLGPDLKPTTEESRRTEYMTCDYCGGILSRLDVKWIRVHSEEYDRVLLAIKKLAEAERKAQNESSQPRGVC